MNPKEDDRPKCGGWAPGEYIGKCTKCAEHFIGDKRAAVCADCAYAENQPKIVRMRDHELRHGKVRCRHNAVLVDDELSEVECADCGEKLNPIRVMMRFYNKPQKHT